jgi:predicted Zn-dependent peptidase
MPVAFQHATLPNGLTIIAETDPAALTAAAGFFVRTGARDEAPALMGVSHFLEHMMFKGTDKRSADDVNRDFDHLGARANAYTSSELTAFHAATLPERLPDALEILADILRPALRDHDFATEKGVILEEIAMYADDPVWRLYEQTIQTHYGAHPLGHRVLGTAQTITDLAPDQMRSYFQQRYSADNTVLALAGNVDFPAITAAAQRLCGHWQRTGATRHHGRMAHGEHHFQITDAKLSRAYRLLVAPGPGMTDPRRYPAFVLAQLLGGSDNSRLHWALIEPGIAEEADAGYDPRDGVGDFRLFIATEPQRLEEAWAIARRELADLAKHITPQDVERIVAKVATGVVLAGERPDGRMHRIGRQWMYQSSYTTLEDELARIEAVTVDDVRSLLADMPWSPATTGTLLPAG